MNNTATPETIAQAVADNAKSGRWLSCTFQVQHPDGALLSVGVKAFGRWVQRIECAGLADGIPEQRTLRDLKARTAEIIRAMLAQA